MKKLPRAFCMGPFRVEVRAVSVEEMDILSKAFGLGAACGLCDYGNHRIYVLKTSKAFNKQSQMHAFWHEYFHMLLHVAGRDRLSRDEVLVDACGALQLQALNTAEF